MEENLETNSAGLRRVDRMGRPCKHGMHGTPEYKAWQKMLDRCNNPRSQRYDRYGGRGISVCDTWSASFEAFYNDLGPRPSNGHSIDRIDNDGNYEPKNCRWATREQQNRNKVGSVFLEFGGERKVLADWSRDTGIGEKTLSARLQSGWTMEEVLTVPPSRKNRPRGIHAKPALEAPDTNPNP